MTKPITKAQADKQRVADYWEWCRTHDPKAYVQHTREQQQHQESARFFKSDAGQSLIADLEAWMATPDIQGKMADWDQRHQELRIGHNRTAYALLDVQPGASQTQIKRAYRQKARALHPDKGGDEAAMKRLNEAYQKLLAPKK